jgi:hypothetical protein
MLCFGTIPVSAHSKAGALKTFGPLSLSDLTQSSVQSLLRILHIEVEVIKKLSDVLALTPGSLLGE